MRTRLEFIIRSKNVRPAALARAARLSREHVRRMRVGLRVSSKAEDDVLEGLQELAGRTYTRADVMEPESVTAGWIAWLHALPGHRSRGPSLGMLLLAFRESDFVAALDTARDVEPSEMGVRDLLDAGDLLLDSAPVRADAVYQATLRVVAGLTATPEPLAQALAGHAEKGRANALRMRGEYRAALSALVRTERHFIAARYCRRELGYARYCGGTVLFKMERWNDSEAIIQRARVFLDAEHERAGVINCDVVLGCIFLERGELDRAREIFTKQEKVVVARNDRETLARLWMNIAVCDLRRHDAPAAATGIARATEAFQSLQMDAEVARARWCRAKLLLLEKRGAAALREFQGAAGDFVRLGMPLDAAFVKLDLLEELVEKERWDEVGPLASSIADLFLRCGVRPSAAAAMDFLRRAVTTRRATRDLVTRVARHVRRSEVFPEERFNPESGAGPA
jgi:tetratricopeptide (TPR) repeat protein